MDADPPGDLRLYWTILGVCLLLSAWFSSAETAMISLGKVRVRRLKERHQRLGAVVERLARNPDRVLSTILLGNNLVNTAASSAATALAIALFPANPILVATVGVTVLLLVFAEVTPKVIAASRPEAVALLAAQPIDLLARVAGPLVNLLTLGPRLILRLFGITVGQPGTTGDDIKTIAVLGREEGILGEHEEEIIHSVVEFGVVTVGEIMVPRVDVRGVEVGESIESAVDLVVESGHSRLPLYEGTMDEVVGVLHARDLLAAWRDGGGGTLRSLARPALYVSEHMKVRDLFRDMREGRQRMAVVIDEYGGVAGIVAHEDVLGEIVGEMVDEPGEPEEVVARRDGTHLVSGQVDVEDLNEELGLALPLEEAQTLSGLVVGRLGRVPFPGEEVPLPGAVLHVLDADRRRVYRFTLRKPPAPPPPAGS